MPHVARYVRVEKFHVGRPRDETTTSEETMPHPYRSDQQYFHRSQILYNSYHKISGRQLRQISTIYHHPDDLQLHSRGINRPEKPKNSSEY